MVFLFDNARDAALNEVLQAADRAIYCNGSPSSYSEADTLYDSGNPGTTFRLAERPVSPSEFTGPADFSDANGNGRKISLTKGGWLALANGDADHVALVDDNNNTLLQVSEATLTTLQEGFAYNNLVADFKVYDAQTV